MKKITGPIPSVNDEQLTELSDILRLMGDSSRLKIIITCLKKPICVTDISNDTELSQALVSHHLRLLRATGLLNAKRQGRKIFYTVNGDYVRCILIDLLRHVSQSSRIKP